MPSLELKVYEIFKARWSEPEASTIIEYFDEKTDKKLDAKKDYMATTKQDIHDLKVEIKEVKSEMIEWMFIF